CSFCLPGVISQMMKRIPSLYPFSAACALLVFLFPLFALAQSSGGTIMGQVSNAATKSYLEGAVVELVGTNRSTVTDREGRFQISGIAGSVTLAVSYSGLDAQQIPVAMESGQVAVRNVELTSSIYQLEKFAVAGQREGTAKA